MAISTTRMTARQFLMLGEDPPGMRRELVNGEVVVSPSPTPDHSNVVVQLILVLGTHVNDHDLGELYQDVDTVLDRFTVRRPDVLFFSKARTHLVGEKAMEGPPDLAVEVVSPGSAQIDRRDKFAQYRQAGVRFYWIIDPDARTLDAWELIEGDYVPIAHAQGQDEVRVAPFAGLAIPLARLWRRRAGPNA